MNPHQTCGTCVWNQEDHCACEASRYRGYPVKDWNRCNEYNTPTPPLVDLIIRVVVCANAFDRIEKDRTDGQYGKFAQQCRAWSEDFDKGRPLNAERIAGSIWLFEQLAQKAGSSDHEVSPDL